MKDSVKIKNSKALASLAPQQDDALLAASALEEFKKRRANAMPGQVNVRASGNGGRIRIWPLAMSLTGMAAAIIIAIILFGKDYSGTAEDASLIAQSAQEVVVVNSINSTEYYTQAGEIRTIVLEDGTKIWMNALTTLRVPSHFQEDIRKVELVEGEAYFDVSHNEEAPFIVSTYDMEIRVLGTEFNVFAYKGHATKASLIRGSIKAYTQDHEKEGTLIKPNQSVSVTAEGHLRKEAISQKGLEEIVWKEGKYVFDNQPLSEIAEKLSLYYGATFTFADENLAGHRYSGKFRYEDGLQWILDALQKADRFEYTYNTETNTIIIK